MLYVSYKLGRLLYLRTPSPTSPRSIYLVENNFCFPPKIFRFFSRKYESFRRDIVSLKEYILPNVACNWYCMQSLGGLVAYIYFMELTS